MNEITKVIGADKAGVLANTDPFDGFEPYYLERGNKNRMILSLKSNIFKEVDWSLSKLLHISKDFPNEFHIQPFDGLVEALLEFPLELSNQLINNNQINDIYIHQTNDAMQILFNVSLQENNCRVISNYQRLLLGLCQRYLKLIERFDNLNEILLNLLNVFETIIENLFDIPKNPLLTSLSNLLLSNDRSFILIGLKILSKFSNVTLNNRLENVISDKIYYVLDLICLPDPYLRSQALEFIYSVGSKNPKIMDKILNYDSLSIIIKNLSLMVFDECIEEFRSDKFINQAITQPLYPDSLGKLSLEDNERIGQMNEPARVIEWIRTLFAEDLNEHISQIEFWHLYNEAFSPYGAQVVLLTAPEVIKAVHTVIPSAQTVVTPDGKYVIKNVRCRHPQEKNRYMCLWGDTDRSVFENGLQLYNYVVENYIDVNPSPIEMKWGNNVFYADQTSSTPFNEQFKAKLKTFIPKPWKTSNAKTEITIPYPEFSSDRAINQDDYIATPPNPTLRPVVKAPADSGVNYSVLHVPHDEEGFPRGIPYLAALLLRLLAQKANPNSKNVQLSYEANKPESKGYFGLPIPMSLEDDHNNNSSHSSHSNNNNNNNNNEESITSYPHVTKLLSAFARKPLADVGSRSVGMLSEVCIEAYEFIQDDNFGSLIVEAV